MAVNHAFSSAGAPKVLAISGSMGMGRSGSCMRERERDQPCVLYEWAVLKDFKGQGVDSIDIYTLAKLNQHLNLEPVHTPPTSTFQVQQPRHQQGMGQPLKMQEW